MKGVTGCDKLWEGANNLWPTDTRMRQLNRLIPCYPYMNKIVYGSKPGEVKHLSTRRKIKRNIDSPSSGERTGKSPNRLCASMQALHKRGCRIGRQSCRSASELQNTYLFEGPGKVRHRGWKPRRSRVSVSRRDPKYHGARGILWEAARTTG
jgi:hypothetical protein